MKTTMTNKLKLRKQTVRSLDAGALARAAGGLSEKVEPYEYQPPPVARTSLRWVG